MLFRNAVSREVVVGAENRVEQCTYAAVITRAAEEMSDEITGGWKVIEVMSSRMSRMALMNTYRSNVTDGAQICKSIPVATVDGYEHSSHSGCSIHPHTLFVAHSSTHHSWPQTYLITLIIDDIPSRLIVIQPESTQILMI